MPFYHCLYQIHIAIDGTSPTATVSNAPGSISIAILICTAYVWMLTYAELWVSGTCATTTYTAMQPGGHDISRAQAS